MIKKKKKKKKYHEARLGPYQYVAARACTATRCPAALRRFFSSRQRSNQKFIFLRDASLPTFTVGIHFQQSCIEKVNLWPSEGDVRSAHE